MGMKHNPEVILYAAKKLKDTNVCFVVISEGTGFDYLKNNKIENIKLFPLQPFEKIEPKTHDRIPNVRRIKNQQKNSIPRLDPHGTTGFLMSAC